MAAPDIATWLREQGLGRYEQTFRANDIDADVLPELAEADLEKLGVAVKRVTEDLDGAWLPSVRQAEMQPPLTTTYSGRQAS